MARVITEVNRLQLVEISKQEVEFKLRFVDFNLAIVGPPPSL